MCDYQALTRIQSNHYIVSNTVTLSDMDHTSPPCHITVSLVLSTPIDKDVRSIALGAAMAWTKLPGKEGKGEGGEGREVTSLFTRHTTDATRQNTGVTKPAADWANNARDGSYRKYQIPWNISVSTLHYPRVFDDFAQL